MHSPGKLLLSAVVALLLLGDAVTRTTATTTSNAFLRAAVDTRTSEEPGSVKGNPKLDEERGFENLTSWLRGWGSSGRSSSVKKQLAKNPSTMNLDEVKARLSMMGTEMTSKQRKEEKKRLSEVSNVPTKRRRNLPAHFKKISEGKEEKRNELFKVWMGDGVKSFKGEKDLRIMFGAARVEEGVVNELMHSYNTYLKAHRIE